MSVVLDASAIIAMLKGERGAAKVAAEIGGARVSSVNYAEVVSHFVHAGMPEREVDAMLDPLPLTVVPVGSIRLCIRTSKYRLQPKGRPQMESCLPAFGDAPLFFNPSWVRVFRPF
ncbi:PIN domain-containing protein [Sphingomonas yabuuchiae]|uniref:PIN domain-containing protein n=1 Tax=Sphingomonas yabuuchiae TaxID=172044 RepID=UPI000ABB1510|nr:PIN domain-containing protein [Sphingomonas yabuuchiae]